MTPDSGFRNPAISPRTQLQNRHTAGTSHLILGDVDDEIIFVFARGLKLLRRNDELFTGEPAASIDHDVMNLATGVIKNNVINFSSLWSVEAIDVCASNILRCIT